MKTELATKQGTALANTSEFDDFNELDGYGNESSDDFVLPRYAIVNTGSKCLKEPSKMIQGAKFLDLVDLSSKTVLATDSNPVRVVFLKRDKIVKIWDEDTNKILSQEPLLVPLEDYAMSVGAQKGSKEKDQYKWFMPNTGARVVETWDMYGINLDDNCAPFIISLKDSNLKKDVGRAWWSNMRTKFNVTPDGQSLAMHYSWHKMVVFKDENARKESWANIRFDIGGKTSSLENYEDVKLSIKSFQKILKSGEFKTAEDDTDSTSSTDDRM